MRNSIKAKIVVGLLLVICLAVGLAFSVTAYDISAYSRDTIVGFTAKQLQQVDRTVTQFLEEARFNAVMMSQNPMIADIDDSLTTYKHSTEPVKAHVRDGDALGKQLSEFLRMVKDSHESYVEVYVGSRFGGFIESYPVSLPAGYDPTVRPWFKEASAAPDQPIVSKAYMSTNGEATISVAKAAKVGNTVHAVVAMDIGLGVLTDMVKAIKLGRTGFVMMVQDDGVVIANPLDADTNFKNVADLEQTAYAHMFSIGQGDVTVTLNGVEYVGSVYTSPVTGWKYFGVVEKAEVMQSVYDVLKSMSIIFAVALLVIVLFVWFFVEYTTARPLRTVVDFLRGLAACNYEQQLQVRSQDEVGQIFASLNHTAEQLCDNMREISRKTEEAEDKARVAEAATQQARNALEQAERARAEGLLHAATQLEAVVAGISHAAREMTSMTEGIRSGTEIQRERIQATATAMEEMNATVLEVAKNAGNAADQGNGVRDKAQEGAAIVGRSITAMNTTQKQAGALNEDMAKLDEQARAIGNIMTVISDIADQTNLLALNAAIEAARAGDAGRGFAVVADEVRKLAEKTMHATQEVGASIKSIQQVAADNVTAMTSAVKDLQQATDLANASGETLSGIVRGTEQSAGQIQSIATAAEEQSAASEEITRAIDEINGIALDTAESVDEATTALNELADQTRELVKLVEELKREGGRH